MMRTCFWAKMKLAAAVTVAALVCPASAGVKLPPLFSDHMVLQRDMPVPVWGTAEAGAKVTVKLRDQTKAATAGADGKWSVKLDPLKAGGPDALTVNEVILADVLVGEVWIGSGQSNMDLGVSFFAKGDPVLARTAGETYPRIRCSQSIGTWQIAEPKGNMEFSALLFAFGVQLHKELNVPVGLIEGAVNGSASGPWLTDEMLKDDAASQAVLARAAEAVKSGDAQKKYAEALAAWEVAAKTARETKQKEPSKPVPPPTPGQCRAGIGSLYAKCIQPMMGYGIRGVLWDQGESGTAIESLNQYYTMGALIRGWRKAWGQGEFPFVYIQKPSGGGYAWDATGKGGAAAPLPAIASLSTRTPKGNGDIEDYLRIMTYPNTTMAISIDLGGGLHPGNKWGYGHRAVDVAMGMVYGSKVEYYGPLYASHVIEGSKVRVKFTHVGQGLAFRGAEKLQGFAVAGEDKVFQWADAVIDGDAVVVSNAQVPKPVAVRYAWAAIRTWANLFNKDGLPAISFRTDPW